MIHYLNPLAQAADTDATSKPASANNKINVAVIGTNGRVLAHIECLTSGVPDVEVTYVCDVDDRAIAKGIKETLKRQKTEPKWPPLWLQWHGNPFRRHKITSFSYQLRMIFPAK